MVNYEEDCHGLQKNGPRTLTCTRCTNRDVAPLKRGLTFALKSFIQFVLVFFVRRVFQAIFLSFCNFLVISFQKRTNNSFVKETNISGCVQRSPRL